MQLCGSDRVRVMQASSREEWDAALAAAGSRADNCSAYRIELLDSIALAAEDEEQELIQSGSGAGGLAAAAVDLATAQRIGGRSLLSSAAAEGRAEAARSWRKLAWDRAKAAAWAAAARRPRNARAPTTRTASPSHEQLQRASHTYNSVLTDRDSSTRNRRRLTGVASTPAPVSLTSPVTIRGMGSPVLGRDSGRRGAAVVLDLGLLRSALVLGGPEARLTLESVMLTNLAAPHPGVLSLPLYWVSRCGFRVCGVTWLRGTPRNKTERSASPISNLLEGCASNCIVFALLPYRLPSGPRRGRARVVTHGSRWST